MTDKKISAGQQPLIVTKNLVKTYQDGEIALDALQSINLTVYPGEYVGVIGKSGAGKTTLINMLSGIDRITSGEVHVNGTAVHELKEDELAHWRGLNLGVIYQSFHLLPMLSLRDNITLAMDLCGKYRTGKSEKRAMTLLESVELAEHAHKPPAYISGGQKQRVAIARALANDPAVILADEPTGRLDSVTSETIFKIFEDLIAQGRTILMVSHDRTLAQRVDRVIELDSGHIISDNGGKK
ncbi:MAG: ABC transporter ATP-binding protein [Chloroflexota bacterium]|nr:ABC transporter ATP-binding protein [Chloroflexota bacterium]